MKKRGIFKSLVAVVILGLTLILSLCSCSQQGSQQGEISFTIPHEVFSQIAARAISNLSEADGTDSKVEIYTVPDEDDLTFTISLYDSSNKLINTKSQSKTFAKWLEASANKDISFTFPNIAIGKSVYATASATAVINGKTIEICSNKSSPIIVSRGSNPISLELEFIVVNEPEDEINLEITIDTIEPVTGNLNITATPSEKFYLNTGSISLKAVEVSTNADLTANPDITWNAKLLYGGVDINDFGTEYYKFFKDGNNKWSVQLANNLAAAGTYQLYVTAIYKGVTSSQITNIDVPNSYLYEYNFNAPDNDEFNTILNDFKDTVGKLSAPGNFIFTGSLNSDPDLADEQFEDIVSSLKWLYPEYCYSLDMSDFSGGTKLSQDCNISSSKLASIDLPNTITTLELKAFNECSLLKSITIPGTIATIEGGAFYKCSSLEEIKFSSENSTYYNDSTGNLCKIDGSDKILLYPSATFLKNPNFASTGITKIGAYAFNKVTLSGPLDLTGIVSFEQTSFQYATISSIASFGSITEIPSRAFQYAEITGALNFTGTSVGEYAFYYAKLSAPLDFTGITSLGESAFERSTVTSITSFGNLTTVPVHAFQSCEGLTTVNLAGIVTVGEGAFYSCGDLTTIENYENLQTIELAGFRNCDDLSRFTIKEGLTLGKYAFANTWIDELIIDIEITADNVATIKKNYFVDGNDSKLNRAKHIIFNKKAVIPDLDASFSETNLPENTYQNTASFLYPFTESSNAKNNLQSIEFKVADSSIGKNQFINYKQLTEIKTNGNVTSIGDFAFYGCTSLTTIDIEDIANPGDVVIGTKAFENTGINY